LPEVGFVEAVVWRLTEPLSGSTHNLKYRLAYVVASACVLRHDNEAGMGHHRHVGTKAMPCVFVSVDHPLEIVTMAEWAGHPVGRLRSGSGPIASCRPCPAFRVLLTRHPERPVTKWS
jgi:hypothetical protein